MANRRLNQFSYSFSVPVHLMVKVSIGATGAPTIVSGTGQGIKSITRTGAGNYTIALQDTYSDLHMVKAMFITAGGALPAAPVVSVKTNSVTSASAPLVAIQTENVATTPAATDPASGETMLLEITLKNTSIMS